MSFDSECEILKVYSHHRVRITTHFIQLSSDKVVIVLSYGIGKFTYEQCSLVESSILLSINSMNKYIVAQLVVT